MRGTSPCNIWGEGTNPESHLHHLLDLPQCLLHALHLGPQLPSFLVFEAFCTPINASLPLWPSIKADKAAMIITVRQRLF